MFRFRLIITVDGDPGPSASFEFNESEHFKTISPRTVAEIKSACQYMKGREVAIEIRTGSIVYRVERVRS
jgi:hypothetical protein